MAGVWVTYYENYDIRVLSVHATEQDAYQAVTDPREAVAFVPFGEYVEKAVRSYYRRQPCDNELPRLEEHRG